MNEINKAIQGLVRRPFLSVIFAALLVGSCSGRQDTSKSFVAGTNQSALLPRDSTRSIDLKNYVGSSYLQATQSAGGIYDKTAADDASRVTIVAGTQTVDTTKKFDPRVGQRFFGLFINGDVDAAAALSGIQGASLSPKDIRAAFVPHIANLKNASQANIAVSAGSALALLASGSGTLVQIDDSNYFYNVGYESPVVKSGRSFGVPSARGLLDPSDRDYLSEMDNYLRSIHDNSKFYTALLNVLVRCDSSTFSALDGPGQVVGTDFFTIYTAELLRHLMVGLAVGKSPWEIDLAEVTILSSYGAASGKVMKNGKLVSGDATAYYGVGASGSGIGDTRSDFTALAKKITAFENGSGNHPEIVARLVALTPIQDASILAQVNGDIFRRYLVYLNRLEYQSDVQAHGPELAAAMASLLMQIKGDQGEITSFIGEN
jgi:hypothetical protein